MKIVAIDSEIQVDKGKILDIGAVVVNENGVVLDKFNSSNVQKFTQFISGADYIIGHNIINHDAKYLGNSIEKTGAKIIDTLLLSPLIYPHYPHHNIPKLDKINPEKNDPYIDSVNAKDLFFSLINDFKKLPSAIRLVLTSLLYEHPNYNGFFTYIDYKKFKLFPSLIYENFDSKICENIDIIGFIKDYPVELAYVLATIYYDSENIFLADWVRANYPNTNYILKALRNTPCECGCKYCNKNLDAKVQLKKIFGYDEFNVYDGKPLQESAVKAAVNGQSLLALFPTGGGKSLTFQLPALMAKNNENGLTVVITPLQALMKDQVDNLNEKGIVSAVTLNGQQDPLERREARNALAEHRASLLYISPEQLRSGSIEKLLIKNNIVRFVIDEAHCFSAWGHDFRVDYLYIADFIKKLQKSQNLQNPIPVSCFTATAKQKVISDICDYFSQKLNIDFQLFIASTKRENLRYHVIPCEDEKEKKSYLKTLIDEKNCPTIVYVTTTSQTTKLANWINTNMGINAVNYNGKMDRNTKKQNQDDFKTNKAQVMVATSAFGMGVDKKDVKLVIHYEISDSLENYIQEAGRAGRDKTLTADCYILYNEEDLNKHFRLLNQSKLSLNEIKNVWRAVKEMTKKGYNIRCSALEIANQAGCFENSKTEVETKVKTALLALENSGYLKRGLNVSNIYASSINAKNRLDAEKVIEKSSLDEEDKTLANNILKYLFSSRNREQEGDVAESRIDHIADTLGVTLEKARTIIRELKMLKLLADKEDLTAYVSQTESAKRICEKVEQFLQLEEFIISQQEEHQFDVKFLNGLAIRAGLINSTAKKIKIIENFWHRRNYIKDNEKDIENDGEKDGEKEEVEKIKQFAEREILEEKLAIKKALCPFIVYYLYDIASTLKKREGKKLLVHFSLLRLFDECKNKIKSEKIKDLNIEDVEESLLYLSKIDAITMEGGFFVSYNAMKITRIEKDNKIKYKQEDYAMLDEYYKNKTQQIHIVGEYAKLMVENQDLAFKFVDDYFTLNYRKFINTYFKGERSKEIMLNITPAKYQQLFGELNKTQLDIITDDQSKYIAVMAGPGSGKTKVLVHKLASLLLLEDIKQEQLLMLTFSRSAATEFRERIMALVKNQVSFVDIKTFHSYCFDILGVLGNIYESQNVVERATEMIKNGEVEPGKITKSVIVIDEAQDMGAAEYNLLCQLIESNEDMRVIAVGDDDQNIYEFRGSSSVYLEKLITDFGAKKYEMTLNYRSSNKIVEFANCYLNKIEKRLKQTKICAVNDFKSNVQLVKHCSENLEQPIINSIIDKKESGSICVITKTNEKALLILGLLNKNNINAKLIQSLENFKMHNLVEVRYFLSKCTDEIIIDNTNWKMARSELINRYKKSALLNVTLQMIDKYHSLNSKLYKSDFEQFAKESNLDDFCEIDNNAVTVSTIHKAKGREFDTVYLMLFNDQTMENDGTNRELYVAITRAKSNLYIHTNSNVFDSIDLSKCEVIEDNNYYDRPELITYQLNYKDVFLDFFDENQAIINTLYAGTELKVGDYCLGVEIDGKMVELVKYSKKFMNDLARLENSNYSIVSAKISFIVMWKNKKSNKDLAIILPEIILTKNRE